MTNTQLIILIVVLIIIYWYWQQSPPTLKSADDPNPSFNSPPLEFDPTTSYPNPNHITEEERDRWTKTFRLRQQVEEELTKKNSEDQILNCPGPEDIPISGPSTPVPDKFGNTPSEDPTPPLSRKQKRQQKNKFRYD